MQQVVCVRRKKKITTKSAPPKTHDEIHSSSATATTSRRLATKRVPRVSSYSPASIDPAARSCSYLGSAIKLIWRGAPQNKVRGSEATEGIFCLRTKKPFHGTVRTGFFYFIVCLIAYSSRIFAPLTARAVRYWFLQTRHLQRRATLS